jgi:hypothetical protein
MRNNKTLILPFPKDFEKCKQGGTFDLRPVSLGPIKDPESKIKFYIVVSARFDLYLVSVCLSVIWI